MTASRIIKQGIITTLSYTVFYYKQTASLCMGVEGCGGKEWVIAYAIVAMTNYSYFLGFCSFDFKLVAARIL